jgi:hypothetical protein
MIVASLNTGVTSRSSNCATAVKSNPVNASRVASKFE